ncbi:MAG: thiazole synthase [Phycisphaerales bacterium]
MTTTLSEPGLDPITIASRTFNSRLCVGTGKYASMELMRDALDASGAEAITVAVRRERLFNEEGKSLLEYIDLDRYTILPNTAGCFNAEDAVRVARLGRELLEQLGNPGASWVKLEVLGDKKTLLPDPVGTLQGGGGTRQGRVRCQATRAMTRSAQADQGRGGGSYRAGGLADRFGAGCSTPTSCCALSCSRRTTRPSQDRRRGRRCYASDARYAMELGADGVLLNTAIAHAKHPVMMARRDAQGAYRGGSAEISCGPDRQEALRHGELADGGGDLVYSG